MKEVADWLHPLRNAPTQDRASVEKAYWDQAMCMHREVMGLIAALQQQHPDTRFIIHGDHGPKLYFKTRDAQTEADDLHTFLATNLDPATAPPPGAEPWRLTVAVWPYMDAALLR